MTLPIRPLPQNDSRRLATPWVSPTRSRTRPKRSKAAPRGSSAASPGNRRLQAEGRGDQAKGNAKQAEAKTRSIVAERSQGSFTRQLSPGEGVDSENLTAAYADGALRVTLPASQRSQPRRVEVTHAIGASRTISGSTVEQDDAPAGSTGGAS